MASLWTAGGGAKGKWPSKSNWEPEVVPTSAIDALFSAAHGGECKVSGPSECRSLVMAGYEGILFFEAFTLSVGGSTAQAENIAFEAPVGAEFTGAGTLAFVSTVTTVAQKILCKGKTIPWSIRFTKAGKWQLAEAFRFTQKVEVEAGTLEGNGQLIEGVEGGSFEPKGTASVDLKSCTLKLAGVVLGWNWSSSGTLTTNAATVFEIGNASFPTAQFGGGGQTYNGTVKLIGKQCRVDSALGQTIAKLEIANGDKEFPEGGIDFKQGAVTEFTSSLTTNGKAGELARAESNETGKPWKLKHAGDYEPANSFLAIKDCTFEGGTLYLPHGEDLGGNTNIKFEEKPSEGIKGKATGAIVLTGTSSATLHSVVTGSATGPLLLTGTAKGQLAGAVFGHATGALVLTGTSKATLRALVSGKATGTILLTGTSTGQRISKVTGQSTGTLLLTGTSKGTVAGNITGKASGVLLLTGHAKPVSLTHPPSSPGVSSPQQSTGSSSPSQLLGVTSA